MARKSATHQPSLLDWEPPSVTPSPTIMIELQRLLTGLMGEIGQALVNVASGEDSREQDNS